MKPQPPKDGPWERFVRGEAPHKTNRAPTKNSGRYDKIEYLDDWIGIRCTRVKEPHSDTAHLKCYWIVYSGVVLAKNHEKSIRELWKWSYKMLVSNDLLRISPRRQAWFWSFWHVKKISALNFSISTSKIHMAEVPSLKYNPPCRQRTHAELHTRIWDSAWWYREHMLSSVHAYTETVHCVQRARWGWAQCYV